MTAEPARLLVVDDDAELRELAQAYLKQQGFEVEAVADGSQMDTALAARTFDLIILDLMLPGEDGLSIAKRLKGQLNVPIIIVSAQGEDVDRIVGLEIGADDYIGKPFNPRELLARIRAVLRRAQSRSAAAGTGTADAIRSVRTRFECAPADARQQNCRADVGRIRSARDSRRASEPGTGSRSLARSVDRRRAFAVRPLDRRPRDALAQQDRTKPVGARIHQDDLGQGLYVLSRRCLVVVVPGH